MVVGLEAFMEWTDWRRLDWNWRMVESDDAATDAGTAKGMR
jgi:hypothetical protein